MRGAGAEVLVALAVACGVREALPLARMLLQGGAASGLPGSPKPAPCRAGRMLRDLRGVDGVGEGGVAASLPRGGDRWSQGKAEA